MEKTLKVFSSETSSQSESLHAPNNDFIFYSIGFELIAYRSLHKQTWMGLILCGSKKSFILFFFLLPGESSSKSIDDEDEATQVMLKISHAMFTLVNLNIFPSFFSRFFFAVHTRYSLSWGWRTKKEIKSVKCEHETENFFREVAQKRTLMAEGKGV